MVMTRGANPVWSMVDLIGRQLDDDYYMFVLQNELPYIPATVWHDASGTIPWNNPIQFLANGTLPIDIYFDPEEVYRLEIREGNTQSAPLIYLIENYTAEGGGDNPINAVSLATDNQITNPQFSQVSFESDFTLTNVTDPDPIEVAPGWFLNVAGTGSITLSQIALNNTNTNPTNAPYALQITLTGGFTSAYLSQRFDQNGMLWTQKFVSASVTAQLAAGIGTLGGIMVDSNGDFLGDVLQDQPVSSGWVEYQGSGQLGETVNPDVPPAAWVEFRLLLTPSIDILLTSFQLVASDVGVRLTYEQETIERQVDHLFHYYANSLLIQPKNSIVTGWDFPLNPWQSRSPTLAVVSTNQYVADQTIVIQQAYVANIANTGNVECGQAAIGQNLGFKVEAQTATNQFALVQYIAPATVRPYWGGVLSSLIKLTAQKQNDAELRVKMRLIWRTSLPGTVAQTNPVATWVAGQEPSYSSGWTAIAPKNDPVYSLVDGANILKFESFELPVNQNVAQTLGVVVYTLDSMIESGTPDFITFDQISLVPNSFAMEYAPLTESQTILDCEYYYRKSFQMGVIPASAAGFLGAASAPLVDPNPNLGPGPIVTFGSPMVGVPTVATYNPNAAGNHIYTSGTPAGSWVSTFVSDISSRGFVTSGVSNAGSVIGQFCWVHWTANARLGK